MFRAARLPPVEQLREFAMDDANEKIIRQLREAQALARLIGDAPSFRDVIAMLPAAARTDGAVLITGETGTGKELVARAIHYISPRVAQPFVAVNCGSLTDTLLEDELFGHEPGAFTDARQRRVGLIALADRGTLFLDEIDALTSRAQVSLLRVLQDRTFRPLGASQEQRADVRFVAASNAPLLARVEAGTFRADLYYRLCVFPLALPPLRERPEDIPKLARHFLDLHTPEERRPLALSTAAIAVLVTSRWPGNVRELENVIIRAVGLSPGPTIEVHHLGLHIGVASRPEARDTFRSLKRLAIATFERDYLIRLLLESRGNVTRAARAAGKERRGLGKLLKKYRLDPKRFVGAS
jgi:DNA-binding NtrC family response regulator